MIWEILRYIRANSKAGDWVIDTIGNIRWADKNCLLPCPICWVATRMGKNPERMIEAWWAVARNINLPFDEAWELAGAADNRSSKYRKELLVACHLVPVVDAILDFAMESDSTLAS